MIMLYFSLLFIALGGVSCWRWMQRRPLRRWYNHLDLKKHLAIFNRLFKTVNGFALSLQARNARDAIEYTYGEIDFTSFIALISLTQPDKNTVFYDLGSGTGKAVFACAMVFDIKKSCGVELFAPLHEAALQQLEKLEKHPDYKLKAKPIQLINKNFLHVDFNDATLIFINASAFFGETWEELTQRLKQTHPDTIIITTSKKLSTDVFTNTRTLTVQMSWGLVEAHIHKHNRVK